MDDLKGTLASAIRGLEAAGARFAVIGGIAAIVHGSIRLTRDFDVMVSGDSVELGTLRKALERESFAHDEAKDVMKLGNVILLRFWKPHEFVFVDVSLDVRKRSGGRGSGVGGAGQVAD